MYTKATSQLPNALVVRKSTAQNERYASGIFDNEVKINTLREYALWPLHLRSDMHCNDTAAEPVEAHFAPPNLYHDSF